MIKLFQITIICISATLIVSCSQVLQTVDLRINTEDNAVQEEFSVIEKTLTIKEAQTQKKAPYKRSNRVNTTIVTSGSAVIRSGIRFNSSSLNQWPTT